MTQTKAVKAREMKTLKVLSEVINGVSLQQVAKSENISRSRAYRIIRTPEAQQSLEIAFYESLDQIRYKLPALTREALGVLMQAMTHQQQVQPKAILAAKIVLERVDRLGQLLLDVPEAAAG
jgi:hypothetical protein